MRQGQSASTSSYPVDAFPKVLRDSMTAIHEDTQIPIEMIGSTLLAALSLALQPLIEVASPFGNKKPEPCSLYFLTLAKSGEGKSPLRELLMTPFDEFASEMHKEYEDLLDIYNKDHVIWLSKEKALNRSYQKAVKNGGDGDVEEILLREHHNAEPVKPKSLKMFYEDATPESIIQGLSEYPYAGVFADEAITFFTGHLKNNLGLLNKIWRNEPLSVSRKKDGTIHLNAYLTFLLMVQPDIFEEYLERHGSRAVSSGFLARFLFTETVSTIGQRRITLNQEKTREALNELFKNFDKLLKEQKERFYNADQPKKTLSLSEDAKIIFTEKVNQYQQHIAKNQPWEHIPEFISKAGSHAIRIAAMFDRDSENEISDKWLKSAFIITEWHLNQTSKYFYKLSPQYQFQQDVYDLFDWIKKRFINPKGVMRFPNNHGGIQEVKLIPWQPFMKNDFETSGPLRLRRVANLEPVLDELIALGLVVLIRYPVSNTIYIAMAGYDVSGNAYAMNPAYANFIIVKSKTMIPQVLENYDHSQLQWRDMV
ncbi:DUF3987 domain-containing protein [Salmonella enterica]|nr:DUF3987 domain-containing protein [Salmonella enterica]